MLATQRKFTTKWKQTSLKLQKQPESHIGNWETKKKVTGHFSKIMLNFQSLHEEHVQYNQALVHRTQNVILEKTTFLQKKNSKHCNNNQRTKEGNIDSQLMVN